MKRVERAYEQRPIYLSLELPFHPRYNTAELRSFRRHTVLPTFVLSFFFFFSSQARLQRVANRGRNQEPFMRAREGRISRVCVCVPVPREMCRYVLVEQRALGSST